MLIHGHRGASATHPENTLEAFRAAFHQGADGVELDVRLTTDGELVVHHDPTLADGRAIRALPRAALPASIPTLAEVLAAGPWWLNIEIKVDPDSSDADRSALTAATLTAIDAASAAARVLVSSFDGPTLHLVHAAAPILATGWLAASGSADALIAATRAAGCVALHPADRLVDEALVAAAHAVGLAVNVWTVDDPARIRHLASLGADAVITNHPAGALAALAVG